ncbi:solute:Na+ symporter, SSS family [Kushneria avicenniae]|uniref:Solute:Na+ symporter, SSS family n=1 Tax=Kushneria avicenniae TaxID=402385 RepID=A0A1I1LPT2_9GAMM|nr:sodium:solute symporter family protein [Kushneria avicenniae]SFC75039.1 solute:Na+ symporter, SSS family [Kushneria avicenniae]
MTGMTPLWLTLLYIALALGLGIRARGGHAMTGLEQWGVAGRSMNAMMLYLLIGAGSVSAYTFMGAPGWAFSRGVAVFYVVIYLSYLAVVAWYFGPKVWTLGARFGHVTQASAIRDRFESTALGALASLVMAIGTLAYAVLQTMGAAYILSVMSGGLIPIWVGVLMVLGVMGSYLYISGQRAIGMTNAFQGGLMLLVAWLVGLWAVHDFTGGWTTGALFERLAAERPEFMTLPGASGNMGFAFWTTSIIVSMLSFLPPVWTQWMSARSRETIRRSATWLPTYYVVILPMVVVGFIGIFTLPTLSRADTVVLETAMQTMPAWLTGLLGAGTLAAAMSSCEPFIHSVALSVTRDVIQPALRLGDAFTARLARWMLFPVLALVAVLAISEPGNLVMILLVGLGFAAQVLPAFIGMFFWFGATRSGVMAGLLAGFAVTFALTVIWPNPLGIHAGFWGLLLNLPLFVVVSRRTRPASVQTLQRFYEVARQF